MRLVAPRVFWCSRCGAKPPEAEVHDGRRGHRPARYHVRNTRLGKELCGPVKEQPWRKEAPTT